MPLWPQLPPKPTHVTVQGMRLPIINTRQAHLSTTIILAAAVIASLAMPPKAVVVIAAYLVIFVWSLRWAGPGIARGRHVEELGASRAPNWRNPR